MRKASALLMAVLLAGCATQTGIVPIGDGIYMSGGEDVVGWNGSKVKARLYAEAAEFCQKQGKRSVPVADTSQNAELLGANASAEIKFRCQ